MRCTVGFVPIDLSQEPYASAWWLRPLGDEPEHESRYDEAVYYSGMKAADFEALALISAYAGSLEVYLWRLLRQISGGDTAATYHLTRDLPVSRVTAMLRAICRDSDWVEFATKWRMSEFLDAADEAFRERNKILHGAVGVSGGALDPSELTLTTRRSREHVRGSVRAEVIKRSDLPSLAESLYVLQEVAIGLWTEARTVEWKPAIPV